MIRNKKNAFKRNIAKNRNSNPKMYYSYVNSAKKNRCRFGPLKNEAGEFVVNPKEQAESMNQFFSSVFTRSDEDFPSKEPINGNAVLDDFEVTEERVKRLMECVKMRQQALIKSHPLY